MQFLLDLPAPLAFLIVCVVTALIAIGGLYFVRMKFPAETLKENHEVAAIIFNTFGLLYAVVVAFVVFVTWGGYDDATKNLQMEANETIDIFYSANGFPDSTGKIIQQSLMDYANSVYNDELKRMSNGEISLYSSGALRKLIAIFTKMDSKAMPNRELYSESLKRLNDLAEYRRLRIFAGDDTIPPVIWLVLLTGAVLTISYTYFFGAKSLRAQYMMTSALTIAITLILFLIYILDHPFSGSSSISIQPMKQIIDIMQKSL
jgi:hypothetical protein